MIKYIIIILAIIACGCEEATVTPYVPPAPKPTERDSIWGDYFTNTAGSEWEYNVSVNSQFSHIAYIKIEKRVLLNKKYSVALWNISEKGNNIQHYTGIIADTVFVYTDINDLTNPQKIVKQYILPMEQYRTWSVRLLEQEFGNDNASGGTNIGSKTVTAGTFNNVLEIERITDAKDRKSHQWINFVQNVGVIRSEILDISTNTTTVWELRKYVQK